MRSSSSRAALALALAANSTVAGIAMTQETEKPVALKALGTTGLGALPTAKPDKQDPTVAIQALEWEFEDSTKILVYGQINKGILNFDDGENSTSYGLTDNANSSTRAGVISTTDLTDEWELWSNIEIQYAPHSSGNVSQLDKNFADYGFDNGNIRRIGVALRSEKYGRFWLGQGSMASDNITEFDLSGTGVIAYSSVADTAAGSLFGLAEGGLSDVTVGSAFTNYDGLGRQVRIRYDTPEYNGFRLKTSYGQDLLNDDDASLYDVAVTYGAELGAFEIAGGAAYARNSGTNADILSGSITGLHQPTGLNLTFATGGIDGDDADGSYVYSKLGWRTSYFSIGETALSLDYYTGEKIRGDGSSSDTWAIAAVQNIDYWKSELWLTYRDFSYDDKSADFRDGQAVFAGLRIKF